MGEVTAVIVSEGLRGDSRSFDPIASPYTRRRLLFCLDSVLLL
jgi:hypothetical protein